MPVVLIPLIVLVPLTWLAVVALVMTACQLAARADARAPLATSSAPE